MANSPVDLNPLNFRNAPKDVASKEDWNRISQLLEDGRVPQRIHIYGMAKMIGNWCAQFQEKLKSKIQEYRENLCLK